jgi:hypothetical protein
MVWFVVCGCILVYEHYYFRVNKVIASCLYNGRTPDESLKRSLARWQNIELRVVKKAKFSFDVEMRLCSFVPWRIAASESTEEEAREAVISLYRKLNYWRTDLQTLGEVARFKNGVEIVEVKEEVQE